MQLFSTVLAAAASVFMMVSAEESANPKSRHSHARPMPSRSSRSSRNPSIIGGDSAVWGPSSGCDMSSFSSPCSSSWSSSSSSCYPCPLPCETTLCNRFSPAVAPICPPSPCEPIYGANCGAYPGPGCVQNACAPCGPCGPRRYGRLANVQPWYVYLTATYTTTYQTTTTSFDSTSVTESTVTYTVFPLSVAPTTYYGPAV